MSNTQGQATFFNLKLLLEMGTICTEKRPAR